MNSRSILLYSVPIMLLLCTQSIANNGYSSSDLAVIETERAAAEAEAAAAVGAAEAMIDTSYDSPWIYVGTSTTGLDYYLDYSSIKKEAGIYEPLRYENGTLDFANSYKRAWWKTVETNGDYSQIQTKFYCNKDVAIEIASANYDVNNNYIGSPNRTKKLDPVIPDTVFSKIAEIVCNVY